MPIIMRLVLKAIAPKWCGTEMIKSGKAANAAEVTAKSYAIEIPLDLFRLVFNKYDHETYTELAPQMEALGADNLEWNGHFGNFVYFTVGHEDFDKVEQITKLVNDYANDFEEPLDD